jgi:hypothetical protein
MKYSDTQEEVLHDLARQNWCDDSTGEMQFGMEAWLFEYLPDEMAERGLREFIDTYSQSRPDIRAEDSEPNIKALALKMQGSWVITENSDGVMTYHKFDSPGEAVQFFAPIEDVYTTWDAMHAEPDDEPERVGLLGERVV